jgi:chromosome segregation ATPase
VLNPDSLIAKNGREKMRERSKALRDEITANAREREKLLDRLRPLNAAMASGDFSGAAEYSRLQQEMALRSERIEALFQQINSAYLKKSPARVRQGEVEEAPARAASPKEIGVTVAGGTSGTGPRNHDTRTSAKRKPRR